MTADLVTIAELAIWTQTTIASDDDFALLNIRAASLLVREEARQPTWTYETAPERALLIAGQLAKRAYLNPGALIAEGIGPLNERRVEDYARTLEFTPAEAAALIDLRPDAATSTGLWVQPTTRGTLETSGPIVFYDSSGSDWGIPYLEPGDVGTDPLPAP